ncbi:MAG: class I SAM-dependent methyltransferase [Candidatus Flexifilum sp.]
MTATSGASVNFDRAADYYDETRGFPPGVETEAAAVFARAGGMTAESRVLEIGIGTGRIALPLARHIRAMHGVDISAGMLARLMAKRTTEIVHPVIGDATRLPYPAGAFDAVVAVHVFHLIPNWRDALREVARVLKPGAPLVHAWGARAVHYRLEDLWQQTLQLGSALRGSIPPGEVETFIVDAGWTPAGAELHLRYTVERSPRAFIDTLRERKWSHTWVMSDEKLNDAVARMTLRAQAEFGDLDRPIPIEQTVRVQAYLPPQA